MHHTLSGFSPEETSKKVGSSETLEVDVIIGESGPTMGLFFFFIFTFSKASGEILIVHKRIGIFVG